MTPYEIDILLWYDHRCEDHPDRERQPPIWQPTVDRFVSEELLYRMTDKDAAVLYVATGRCRAYVAALQSVPLPEQAWLVNWPREPFVVQTRDRE